ncbi:MAG: phenylacetate--CoA ligase family protein [Lachnospiraceae bacterium]|nr:phenylacetate--CoA ligase family protein [Lachnospiraceae bacterium]
MKTLEMMRRNAFWILDSIKGRKVRKAYLTIREIDRLDSEDSRIRRYQKKAFQKLKRHVCQTTDFYAAFSECQFSEFPVITKNDLKENLAGFLSKVYKKENLFQMATSGSTGTPFISYQDEEKKRRVNAEIIYYSEKAGYRLGQNLSYIRTIVKQNQKSWLRQFLQNQTLIHCEKLDDAGIEKMLRQLAEKSKQGPVTLLAYASTYTAIKNYAQKKGIKRADNIRISGLISGAEILYDSTRESVEKLFGAKAFSRYSNEENGVLGQEEGKNNVFVINEADYIIEILDEEGNPLPDGETGRIVVTDLYNYGMPMIRYDTGDVGAITTEKIHGRRKRVISGFSGRKIDVIFDVEGRALSPYAIVNNMWSFSDIRQFQFIQKGKKSYFLKLNADISEKRKQELITMLEKLLGEGAEIVLEEVKEIPVLASGKRRYIVNEWRAEDAKSLY